MDEEQRLRETADKRPSTAAATVSLGEFGRKLPHSYCFVKEAL